MAIPELKSLLSIQSHVSHGYVGSRAATFPLQYQGWDVDAINTVNFSNHTGYGRVKGSPTSSDQLTQLLTGLRDIQILTHYDAVITGYIPNDELIATIEKWIINIKRENPHMLYLLDPVMGDQGYMYVDSSCVEQYKSAVSQKIVDIITPNQFELELLCGFKIKDKDSLIRAFDILHHECNIKYVVITSLSCELELLPNQHDEDVIYCAFSTKNDDSKPSSHFNLFKIPIIKSYFTGVGDLFSALLLDKLHSNRKENNTTDALAKSVNQALTIMEQVLNLTHKLGLEAYCKYNHLPIAHNLSDIGGEINDGETMKFFELKLIQSKHFFDYNGPGKYKCYTI